MWLHGGSHKVGANLENQVAAVQHHTAHKLLTVRSQHLLQGDQQAHCCEDLLFYDWNIFLFFSSLVLFLPPSIPPSILLLPTCSTANHYALCCLQLGPTQLYEVRQPVFSVQWSHLSTHSSRICTAQSGQELLETEVCELCVFCRIFQPGTPAKKQMVNLLCFYYTHLWIICRFHIQSHFERFPYGVVYQ